MLRLAKPEPEWLELLPAVGDEPAVEVQFAPISMPAVRAARRAVAAALGLDPEDMETAGDALSRELIRRGILAWRGIGDADGEPIDVSPETVEMFIADPRAFEAADRIYVWPWVKLDLERSAPGKGSPPSPNGTSDQKAIAGSPAPDAKAANAKSARTKSTRRSPRKKKVFGA